VDPPGEGHCAACAGPRQIRVVYQFHYIHVLWLLAVAYRNEFLLMCDTCGRGVAANPAGMRQVFRQLQRVAGVSLGAVHLLFGKTGFLLVLVPGW